MRAVYRAFAKEGKSERDIADDPNARGIRSDLDRPWTRATIHQILVNEKYIGNNVWNRHSFKLKQKHVRNSPESWLRADGVFEPIVDRTLYDEAQAIIRQRSIRLSDEDLLGILRRLLQDHGYISGVIIDEADAAPSSTAYQSRFGSLLRAYQLVGFTPDRDYRYIQINRDLRRMHPKVVAEVVAGVVDVGGRAARDPATDLLTINDEFTTSVVVVRCRATPAGSLRWQIRLDTGLCPDLTVAVRLDAMNRQAFDYYLLPRLDMSLPRLRLAEHNGVSLDAYRCDTLEAFYELAARTQLSEVA